MTMVGPLAKVAVILKILSNRLLKLMSWFSKLITGLWSQSKPVKAKIYCHPKTIGSKAQWWSKFLNTLIASRTSSISTSKVTMYTLCHKMIKSKHETGMRDTSLLTGLISSKYRTTKQDIQTNSLLEGRHLALYTPLAMEAATRKFETPRVTTQPSLNWCRATISMSTKNLANMCPPCLLNNLRQRFNKKIDAWSFLMLTKTDKIVAVRLSRCKSLSRGQVNIDPVVLASFYQVRWSPSNRLVINSTETSIMDTQAALPTSKDLRGMSTSMATFTQCWINFHSVIFSQQTCLCVQHLNISMAETMIR